MDEYGPNPTSYPMQFAPMHLCHGGARYILWLGVMSAP